MILLVDVGNTCLKWLAWNEGKINQRGHLFHKGCDPAGLGEQLWSELERPSQVIIANVAGPQMAAALQHWIQKTWALTALFAVSEAVGFGVRNAYATPAQMGVDRWVAMIGAKARIAQPCCIVDCGTAITIDALSIDGTHLGGVIFPGIRLMRESLYRDTRQIPAADQGQATVFGQSTQDCVWGGTTFAVAAAIDGITGRMEETLQEEVQRVLTGGDAQELLPHLQGNYCFEPDLIFHGLLVIAVGARFSMSGVC